ncbi:snare-like protein [Coprinopsis marcescibilis]|uniref:Trafficking protein particle complex subunit n=1 Tax=Coprinopsis marcescibilis TaxID=230819 RepID=A0A5C3KYN9_COPMA|nr:snare-like protein [Coprinopsis marcescibilis]
MTINSLYIFDRHCICVYYQDWHRTRRPKPAAEGGLLPGVSQAVSPGTSAGPSSGFDSPRNTLASSSGTVVAINEHTNPQLSIPMAPTGVTSTGLAFDEEAKLVYGVVLSLRNMIKKISGRDEQFTSYRTSSYKLHLFETPSGYKFVMLTDQKSEMMRSVLKQIYLVGFLEFVVRNPLIKMDSREQGIDNDNFRSAVDRYVRGLPNYN